MTTGRQQVLLFIVAAACLALGMDRTVNVYDEGLVLTGAMRVAAGEVPHADFYANYGPAQFYVLAYLFKLFGQSVVVERGLDVVVRAAIVAVCYGIAAAYCRKSIALTVCALCAVWLVAVPFYGYPMFPALLFALVSAALVCRVITPAFSQWRLVGAGACVGLVALFRYDVGFFVFAALAVAILMSVLLTRNGGVQEHRLIGRWIGPYVAGTSIVFLIPASLYLASSPMGAFIDDIFAFPSQYYVRMRRLPFPTPAASLKSLSDWAVYLPILVFAASVYGVARGASISGREGSLSAHNSSTERSMQSMLLVFTLVGIALYGKGLVRVTTLHMLGGVVSSLLILGVLLERTLQKDRRPAIATVVICGLAFVITLAALVKTATHRRGGGVTVLAQLVKPPPITPGIEHAGCGTPAALQRVACFELGSDRTAATLFVIQHTAPGERIFVGLKRHDKIYINDNATYFTAGRLPATRWHHFDPGLQTRLDIQSEMVSELERYAVRYVVLTSEWDAISEPNDSARSSGVHLLDDYIRTHFREVSTYGKISVLSRVANP